MRPSITCHKTGMNFVHFIHQLDWDKGYPGSSKTLFLGVSVRVSGEEISVCIGKLGEANCPHRCNGCHLVFWGPELLELRHSFSPLLGPSVLLVLKPGVPIRIDTTGPWFSGPQTQTELYHQLSLFSSLWKGFSASVRIPVSQFLSGFFLEICKYIFLVLLFWKNLD